MILLSLGHQDQLLVCHAETGSMGLQISQV